MMKSPPPHAISDATSQAATTVAAIAGHWNQSNHSTIVRNYQIASAAKIVTTRIARKIVF
jgi:hypothetical protein